ncbi:hypothetical protein C0J52_22199 [Blattella germanica]|nr:hypothetical protein C0J52_22199 [Blattella germanica]
MTMLAVALHSDNLSMILSAMTTIGRVDNRVGTYFFNPTGLALIFFYTSTRAALSVRHFDSPFPPKLLHFNSILNSKLLF